MDEGFLTRARDCIKAFHERYGVKTETQICDLSSESWRTGTIPFCMDAGCYLFYSEPGELLYIGKASLANNLGARIGSYFGRGPEFALKHSGWTSPPRHLLIVKVSEPWEAPSLEEYLIAKLQPRDNDRGIRRQAQISN